MAATDGDDVLGIELELSKVIDGGVDALDDAVEQLDGVLLGPTLTRVCSRYSDLMEGYLQGMSSISNSTRKLRRSADLKANTQEQRPETEFELSQ